MKPVYILLRETGWRGTDILNLRYNQCLDYVWNSRNKEYVPYLYDEITKTGILLHKIPIRPEIAEMVSELIKAAEEKSTDDNNPDKHLFKMESEPPNQKYQKKEEVHYEFVRKNLDAVKVPFGVCFKPTKLGCKTQTRMCLECSSFCTTKEDLAAYEEEIKRVKAQITIGMKLQRTGWTEKMKNT